MDKFNDRLADVFGALDTLQPSKSEQKSQHSLAVQDKSVADSTRDLYVPPAKRANKSGAPPSRVVKTKHSGRSHGHSNRKHVSPDYVQNPKKWTRYDLKDDGTKGLKGMSADEVNRHAAFEFLHELKQRKPTSEEDDGTAVDDGSQERGESVSSKITFKKPRPKSKQTEDGGLTPVHGSHGNSIVKMPEYVVGRDKGTKQRRQVKRTLLKEGDTQRVRTKTTAAVSLSHLEEDEDC